MVAIAILFSFLAATTWTDIREGKIYNWATYSGILVAFIGGLATSLFQLKDRVSEVAYHRWCGLETLETVLVGFLSCAAIMVVCFVFFAGQVGGGDIKLIAMIGAYLGVYDGFEALLWTFVIAAAVALIRIIWQVGALRLLNGGWQLLYGLLKHRTAARLNEEERAPLKASLCLSPSAMVGVVVAKWDWFVDWIPAQ